MTILDAPRFPDAQFGGPRFNGPVLDLAVESAGGCGDCSTCECADTDDDPFADEPHRMPGFDIAVDMAEAASCDNMTWWNEIRAHAPDPAIGEYASSVLLAQLIRTSAHRWGVPVVDVWDAIRRCGELPL